MSREFNEKELNGIYKSSFSKPLYMEKGVFNKRLVKRKLSYSFLNQARDIYEKEYWIVYLGELAESKGNIDIAVEIFEKGIDLKTSAPGCYGTLFNLYIERKDIFNSERILTYSMIIEKKSSPEYWKRNYQNRKNTLEKMKNELIK